MKPEELAIVVSPEDVQAEVERILTSATMSRSTQLCRLLRFLTDSTHNGGGTPKEHEIATVVFGRSTDFDPATDSIVRVQTTRLRSKLRQYYLEESPTSPIEILITRGEYSVHAVLRNTAPAPHAPVVVQELPPPAPTPVWRTLGFVYASVGIAAVLVLATVLMVRNNGSARVVILQLTAEGTMAMPSKFSPDGKTIYFGAQGLQDAVPLLRSMPAFDDPAKRKESTLGYPGARLYSVSKSGLLLLEPEPADGLLHAPTPGAPAQKIDHGVHSARWGPDGKSMLVKAVGNESTIEYPQGRILGRAPLAFGRPFQNAIPSRSGRWIAFGRPSVTQAFDYDLLALDTRDGSIRTLAKNWVFLGSPAWHPSRDEVIVGGHLRGREPGIFAIGMDGSVRTLWTGTQIMNVDDVRGDGTLLVREYVTRNEMQGNLADGKGFRQLPVGMQGYRLAALSPRGNLYALGAPAVAGDPQNAIHLWDGSPESRPRRFTTGYYPAFSPNGKQLLLVRGDADSRSQVILIDIETGKERNLTKSGLRYSHPGFAADGRSFYFLDRGREDGGESEFFEQWIDSGEVVPLGISGRLTPIPIGSTGQLTFLHSGKLVVWDGRTRKSRILFEVGPFTEVVSASDGPTPSLILDEYPFSSFANQRMTVYSVDVRTAAKKEIRKLETPLGGKFQMPAYLSSRNGETYISNMIVASSKLYLMKGLPLD